MSHSPDELERRQNARRHMAHLKDILAGRTPAAEQPLDAPPPPPPRRRDNVESVPPSTPSTPPTPGSTPPAAKGGRLLPVGDRLRQPRPGRLAELLAEAQRLNRLNQILHAYLPPPLQEHVTLIRLDADAWIVQTDSPAWAARLRYQLPNLRQLLGEQLGMSTTPPQIRIAPAAAPYAPPPRRLVITEQAARTLEAEAQKLSDPRLSAAVLRLARHARQGQ